MTAKLEAMRSKGPAAASASPSITASCAAPPRREILALQRPTIAGDRSVKRHRASGKCLTSAALKNPVPQPISRMRGRAASASADIRSASCFAARRCTGAWAS